jgi:hypothetical protein
MFQLNIPGLLTRSQLALGTNLNLNFSGLFNSLSKVKVKHIEFPFIKGQFTFGGDTRQKHISNPDY